MKIASNDERKRLTSPNYLFISAVAITSGALAWRQFLRPKSTRAVTPKIQTISSNMYGGGDGVLVPAKTEATAVLIFLHGLGDTGHGWASAFPLPALKHVKTILPSAPQQSVTLNAGMKMPSWFDLKGLTEDAEDDEAGILASVARVNRIIDTQIAEGIPAHRIAVGGFSQGGAVAATLALRSERRLAGIVALSSWLPLRSRYPAELKEAGKDVNIFMGHGTADQVIVHRIGEMSATIMQNLGRKVTFKSYPGLTHSASPPELNDLRDFLIKVVPE